MKLIVGLGNPGKEYVGTRHNTGFSALDEFAEMCRADFDHEKFHGVFAMVKDPSFPEPFILAKPKTYMNASGEFVRPLMDYFKIDVADLMVVYDDMALAPGKLRLRPAGSSGSHKGMQSIINHLHSDAFPRIRIGIGEPPHSFRSIGCSENQAEMKKPRSMKESRRPRRQFGMLCSRGSPTP